MMNVNGNHKWSLMLIPAAEDQGRIKMAQPKNPAESPQNQSQSGPAMEMKPIWPGEKGRIINIYA